MFTGEKIEVKRLVVQIQKESPQNRTFGVKCLLFGGDSGPSHSKGIVNFIYLTKLRMVAALITLEMCCGLSCLSLMLLST